MAPPIMDMMRNDEPSSVSSPRPSIPIAKMVGNIMDMKKLVSHSGATASHPDAAEANRHKRTLAAAYSVNIRDGATRACMNAPLKRPIINIPRLAESKNAMYFSDTFGIIALLEVYEETPNAYLGSDIEELCDDSPSKSFMAQHGEHRPARRPGARGNSIALHDDGKRGECDQDCEQRNADAPADK